MGQYMTNSKQADGSIVEQVNSSTSTGILARRPRLRPLIKRFSVRFGGEKHKELERFIKFAFVGLMGTVIDLVILNILLKFVFHISRDNEGPTVVIASSISFTIAVISNFLWNRYWTYPDSRSYPVIRQLIQFFAVNIVGLGIRAVIVALLAVPFSKLVAGLPDSFLASLSITGDSEAQIGGNMAIIASVSVVMIWNFFVNRYWTYNDVE